MLVTNGPPRIDHDESAFSMQVGVFLHHLWSKMQIALTGIPQPGDVLAGFVELDFAVGGNALCQKIGRRTKVKNQIGFSRGRIEISCPVPVDPAGHIASNAGKNVGLDSEGGRASWP